MKKLMLLISVLVMICCLFKCVVIPNHDKLKIHILDTGNSDCIFIESEKSLLIDGAEEDDEIYIIEYLKELGVDKINYVLSTHPHADHIGGLDAILNSFEIDELLMCEGKNTTKEYEALMESIESNAIKYKVPKENETVLLGKGNEVVLINCVLPNIEDKNDWSIVAKLNCGNKKTLFMADAQALVEEKYQSQWEQVDILKVGHHGDITSSSEKFVNKVKPQYAVITTGENPYGHPSAEVLNRYKNVGSNILRTDELGTVVFTIQNNQITYDCK